MLFTINHENKNSNHLHFGSDSRRLAQPLLTHLEAGALQDQVARLDQVQRELQVEVRALAQSLQVADEFGQRRVVQAAIAQRHVALDLRAAVDPLHQVALRKHSTGS